MKMLQFLLLISLMLSFSLSYAGYEDEGFDYNFEASGQTFPMGGLIKARAGYGYKLWQAASSEESLFWKYGYLRPNIELNTAGILNRGAISLEFFPVSIFGITGGVGVSDRHSTYYQDFNCNDVLCNETLTYQFLRARLLGGYKSFLFSVTAKYEKFKSSNDVKPFYEEMSYLVGASGKDDLKTLNVLIGTKLSDRWNLGLMSVFQNFIHSQVNNSAMFLAGNYSESFWQASLGLGQYKSSHQNDNFAAVVSITYTGQKGLSVLE